MGAFLTQFPGRGRNNRHVRGTGDRGCRPQWISPGKKQALLNLVEEQYTQPKAYVTAYINACTEEMRRGNKIVP